MFINLWKNLRLQNQILFIQSLIVGIIFAILISSCIYLVQLFSGFIKSELLEKLVLTSMVSTIKTAIIRVDIIGYTVYNSVMADRQHLKDVHAFQIRNDIKTYSQLEDCLQSSHSQQFYSYQFCYGLYGQTDGLLNLTQIRNYIALQNQIIPFIRRKEMNAYYNIQYDDQQIFFSQYEGRYMSKIDQPIFDALQEMKQYKIVDYFRQIPDPDGQFFLSLEVIPGSKIVVGTLINQTDGIYYKLTQSEKYFNQRSLSVLGSGLIISDTGNFHAFGNWFQNSSYTGFDQDQFQKIKRFADKIGLVSKECYQQLSNDILCLIDINNKQKLVFSRNIDKTGTNPYYIIVIVDIIFLNRIEDEFNEQLLTLIDDVLFNIGIRYIIAFVISVLLQIIFINKLNKPLETLKSVANYHINNYQNLNTIQMISQGQEIKNITQKLSSAFFNLINQTNNSRNIKRQSSSSIQNESKTISGILRRESQKISIKIRRIVQKINYNNL